MGDSSQFNSSKKRKMPTNAFKVSLALLTLIAVLMAGVIYGQYRSASKYDSELDSLKSQVDDLTKTIEESESKDSDAKSDNKSGSNTSAQSVSVENDAKEIASALNAACAKNSTSSQKYEYYIDGNQQVTVSYLQTAKLSNQPVYVSDGYAAMNVSCKVAGSSSAPVGGYVSYLKRQDDGSWLEVAGSQEALECEIVDKYTLPKEIVPTCYNAAGAQVENTN